MSSDDGYGIFMRCITPLRSIFFDCELEYSIVAFRSMRELANV